MRVSINAFFKPQPFTGSGQYLRNLLSAFGRVAPGLDIVPLQPNDVAGGGSGAGGMSQTLLEAALLGWSKSPDLRKVWWEQVSWMRASCRHAADLLHVPYFAPPVWTARPLVVTIHDIIPLILSEYVTSPKVSLYNTLIAVGARRAVRIIADSHATARQIVSRLGIAADRIHVVPLAVSADMKPLDDGKERQSVIEQFGLSNPFIFYIGGFDSRKNVPALIRAFHDLPEEVRSSHFLAIAGELPKLNSHLFPLLQPLTEMLGIAKQIHFLGRVTESEKRALYSAAKLFVFPSTHEGFGLPPLEAMACGAPVLSGHGSSLPEVVQDGAVLVDTTNHMKFTGELATLLDSPRRRKQLSSRGIAVASTYSWDRTAKLTLDVYKEARDTQ